MAGSVYSINVSGSGGVPKLPIRAAFVGFEGVEGDHNKFRAERKDGDPAGQCVFSQLREYVSYNRRGTLLTLELLERTSPLRESTGLFWGLVRLLGLGVLRFN